MDTPPPPPSPRRVTRRTLFRLAGAGVALGIGAEATRIWLGSNEHTVIAGKVYRSAQLKQAKLERVIAEHKIRTVVNLRGFCPVADWYMNDARATSAAGVSQEDLSFSAKRHPAAPEIARLVEVLDRTAYPILLHCAAGADRTGLASGMAVLMLTDSSVSVARRQMWPRYGHVAAVGRTGVLDTFFDAYEAALAAAGTPHTPDRFRQWATTQYCPGPYKAELSLIEPARAEVRAGVPFTLTIRATNRAVEPWRFVTGGSGGVRLRYDLYSPAGEVLYRGHAGRFARTVNPGESIDLVAGFPPVKKPGPHVLNADLLDCLPIDMLDSAFAQYGSDPLIVGLKVT